MGYFISIFLGTFVLEDLALASSLALVAQNKLSLELAFLACFLGISLGDVGLYLIGFAASQLEIEKHFTFFKKFSSTISKMKSSKTLAYSIIISRALPGTRLPTYLIAGFLKYSLFKFIILTLISVFVWVLVALGGGRSLQYVFTDHWILNLGLFLIFLQFLKSVLPKLTDHWQRKAMLYSWRRWLYFEFWPAIVFYLPIVPYYIYQSLRYRSFFTPFYASPHLKHGGLIGESKWDLLQHINKNDASTLKAFKVAKNLDFAGIKVLLNDNGIEYPFVIKPDIGQRGFGVRIIRSDFDLSEYLLLSDFEKIIQRLSLYSHEAGVFYIRQPSDKMGHIFSVTDKAFPYVTGDGISSIGDLILKDQRAQIIAPIYLERFKDQLDSVPKNGKNVLISECGNHCQGAIFFNGAHLISEKLTQEIDRIAKQMPDFYFGRFDVRYKDAESLLEGKNFEIVEINGSGSEATHIWDSRTTLIDAYKTLFKQWSLLFKIGDQVRRLPERHHEVHVLSFFKDCAKVIFRKESISTSS